MVFEGLPNVSGYRNVAAHWGIGWATSGHLPPVRILRLNLRFKRRRKILTPFHPWLDLEGEAGPDPVAQTSRRGAGTASAGGGNQLAQGVRNQDIRAALHTESRHDPGRQRHSAAVGPDAGFWQGFGNKRRGLS